jgi:SNF2-related domain
MDEYPVIVMPPDPSSAFDGGWPTSREAIHEWAGGLYRQLRQALRRYDQMERDCRAAVLEARGPQQQERIQRRLAAMSVEELARGSGVNTKALRDGKVKTAADVHRLTEHDLEAIYKVGPVSASKIKVLEREMARVRAEDVYPSANPGSWSAADYRLVRALVMFTLAAAVAPHAVVLRQVLAGVRWLARATNWLAWLLSPPARRAQVRSRVPQARRDWYSSGAAEALGKLLAGYDKAQRAGSEPDSAIADRWRAGNQSLIASLERLLSANGSTEERGILGRKLASGVSADLLQRIRSLPLDTTRLIMQLRPYQDFGARFAVAVGCGLLGDDMGLGKTIQALAAIAHVTVVDRERHHVVICPAALIDTWLQETERALSGITGWRFHSEARDDSFRRWQDAGGILVTSFEQARHLLDRQHPPIGFLVVDEAHLVKKPEAKRTQVVRSLTRRAGRVLLMGGTLMENRTAELIAIADLADPAQGARLRRQFGDGRDAHRDPAAFRDAIGGLYLRRNQDEVLPELPGIIPMDILIHVDEDAHLASKRAIAARNSMDARRVLTTGDGHGSEKIERLKDLIAECQDAQKKVLVFSQFRPVIALARTVIGEQAFVLHGDVPVSKRPEVVREFQQADGFATLVMQVDVGAVGLNLQAASVVILMEPQLKPSTEWQAVSRSHRMGQTLPVVLYRLIAANSLDERIVQLTNFKAELFELLARRSILADAAAELPIDVRDVSESELLAWGRTRYGLPNT